MGIKIACVAMALTVPCSVTTGCGKPKPAQPETAPNAVPQTGDAEREAIRAKLKLLAETEAPKKLAIGASYFMMDMCPGQGEYICPDCGEKTLYADGKSELPSFFTWELPNCRRQINHITGLKIRLDERSFCKKCSPDTVKPELVLVVSYAAGEHRVKVTANDLALLAEFTAGKLVHDGGEFGEVPLKTYQQRLEALLGVSLAPTPKAGR